MLIELEGFRGTAEVLGQVTSVEYEHRTLVFEGVSLEFAKRIIMQLQAGGIDGQGLPSHSDSSVDDLSAKPAVPSVPASSAHAVPHDEYDPLAADMGQAADDTASRAEPVEFSFERTLLLSTKVSDVISEVKAVFPDMPFEEFLLEVEKVKHLPLAARMLSNKDRLARNWNA